MMFVYGTGGFILGFAAGLFIINMFLRHYSKRDLLRDKSLRWTYGLAVWICAGIGATLGFWLFNRSVF